MRVKLIPCLFGAAVGVAVSFTLFLLSSTLNYYSTNTNNGHEEDPSMYYHHVHLNYPGGIDQQKRDKYLLVAAVVGRVEQQYLSKTLVQATWGCCEFNGSIVYFETAKTINGMDKLDIIGRLCSRHINQSQWYMVVYDLNVYVDIKKVQSLLNQFDSNTPMYFSSPSSTGTSDEYSSDICICGNGNVQILSRELLVSVCLVYGRCSVIMETPLQSNNCTLVGVMRVCSEMAKDHVQMCALPLHTLLSPHLLQYKQISSCAIIAPVNSPSDLYRVHSLVVEDRLNKSIRALETIQQRMDILRYLLQEMGLSVHNEAQEDNKEKFTVWESYSRGLVMAAAVPMGKDPVIKEHLAYTRHFDSAVDMTMNMVNSIDSRSSYILQRVRDSYYRWSDEGLRLVLNLEVRERGASMESIFYYQAQLERLVYPVSQIILNHPEAKQLTIVVVVTDSYANQLESFVDSLNAVIAKGGSNQLAIHLLVVHMEYSFNNPTNKIHNALKLKDMMLDIKTLKTTHQLSRSYALSLAIKEINPGGTIVLLADVNLRFSLQFLAHCLAYPDLNKRIYVPFPTVKQSALVQLIISQLFLGKQSFPDAIWLPFTGIVCIAVGDLVSVATETKENFLEVDMRNLASTLSRKGYQILQGPEEGLEWNVENEDCGNALIGEHCEKAEGINDEHTGSLLLSYYTAQQMILL